VREVRQVAAMTRTLEAQATALPLDPAAERPPPPRPLLAPSAGDRIRAALLRWLEEDL
jgi:hypothetical protein